MTSAASIASQRVRPAQLARLLGVSRQSLGELIDRGIVERGTDGLVDVDLARHAIANRVRPSAKTAQALTTPPPPSAPPSADPDANATSYHVAKTMRESAEAQIARLKLAQMRGELIARTEVRQAAFAVLRSVRDQMLAMPARLSPLLAAETDPAACYRLLDAELRQALAHLQQLPGAEEPAA